MSTKPLMKESYYCNMHTSFMEESEPYHGSKTCGVRGCESKATRRVITT